MSCKLKKRYCECGRELEYRCSVCSECRQINIEIARDRYNASTAHKERARKYNLTHYNRGLKTVQRPRKVYDEMKLRGEI
jgi:hypothetical protein